MRLFKSSADNLKTPVYVYEWNAWNNALFRAIHKDAIRIEAKICQSNKRILKKIKADKGYFLFYINLTKTDLFFKQKEELVAQLKQKGITPLNAKITDTSKAYLQQVCKLAGLNNTKAPIEGDENELLIIKTNLNYGGKPEKKLLRSQFRLLNLTADEHNIDVVYPVVERKKIKKEDWENQNLIIEKYISNKQNYIYRAYKLLDKLVISEAIENNLIKKMVTVEQRINHCFDLKNPDVLSTAGREYTDLLSSLINFTKAFHVDFGAIDIVRSDENKYYIIDVNITPHWNRKDHTEVLNFLASAL